MKEKRTFHGRHYRVQLTVFDFTENVARANERGWGLVEPPTMFHVAALVQRYHKSTAFSRGVHIYHGPDFDRAWREVKSWAMLPDLEIPEDWSKYTATSDEELP